MSLNVQMQGNISRGGAKKTYDPLPQGTYTVKLTSVKDAKVTKAGNGEILPVTFEVVEGDHSGRLIFQNLLIDHENSEYVGYTKNKIDGFLKAVGVGEGINALDNDFTRLGEFTNRLVNARVAIQESKNSQYGPQNKITSFVMR